MLAKILCLSLIAYLSIGVFSPILAMAQAEKGAIYTIDWNNDDSLIAIGYSHIGFRVINASTKEEVFRNDIFDGVIYELEWSPNTNNQLAVAYSTGVLEIIDFPSGVKQHRFEVGNEVRAIDWHPTEAKIAAVARTGYGGLASYTTNIWDTSTGQLLETFNLFDEDGFAVSLSDIDWSFDGTHLVYGSLDKLGFITDANGENVIRFDDLNGSSFVVWNPESNLVATSDMWGHIMMFDVTNSQVLWELNQETRFFDLAWSPNGGYLAVSSLQGIYFLGGITGQRVTSLPSISDRIRVVRWSNNGKFLAYSIDISELEILEYNW